MITLTIKDNSKKTTKIECYRSHDKAKIRLDEVASSIELELTGASYETTDEKALLQNYLNIGD